ncbi:MAG: methionyl-tRNA formyltransferase [Pseudomonadota bacterium]
MALIKKFTEKRMERVSLHKPIDATYTPFEFDGRKLFQLDSYGSTERQIPGKKSQSIQLDEDSARTLHRLLAQHFNL